MQIICPNCDAEYDVDTAQIPKEGREVHCYSCKHKWFQVGPDQAELQPNEDTAPKQSLSEDIKEILKAEAEFSRYNKPNQKSTSIEDDIEPSQPVVADDYLRDEVTQNQSDLIADEDAFEDELVQKYLQPEPPAAEKSVPPVKSGKRLGRLVFWCIVLLSCLSIALYYYAPQIAENEPVLAPLMKSYVDYLNQLRGHLDGVINIMSTYIKSAIETMMALYNEYIASNL